MEESKTSLVAEVKERLKNWEENVQMYPGSNKWPKFKKFKYDAETTKKICDEVIKSGNIYNMIFIRQNVEMDNANDDRICQAIAKDKSPFCQYYVATNGNGLIFDVEEMFKTAFDNTDWGNREDIAYLVYFTLRSKNKELTDKVLEKCMEMNDDVSVLMFKEYHTKEYEEEIIDYIRNSKSNDIVFMSAFADLCKKENVKLILDKLLEMPIDSKTEISLAAGTKIIKPKYASVLTYFATHFDYVDFNKILDRICMTNDTEGILNFARKMTYPLSRNNDKLTDAFVKAVLDNKNGFHYVYRYANEVKYSNREKLNKLIANKNFKDSGISNYNLKDVYSYEKKIPGAKAEDLFDFVLRSAQTNDNFDLNVEFLKDVKNIDGKVLTDLICKHYTNMEDIYKVCKEFKGLDMQRISDVVCENVRNRGWHFDYIIEFAKEIEGIDIKKLSASVAKVECGRWSDGNERANLIYRFAKEVKGADIDELCKGICRHCYGDNFNLLYAFAKNCNISKANLKEIKDCIRKHTVYIEKFDSESHTLDFKEESAANYNIKKFDQLRKNFRKDTVESKNENENAL